LGAIVCGGGVRVSWSISLPANSEGLQRDDIAFGFPLPVSTGRPWTRRETSVPRHRPRTAQSQHFESPRPISRRWALKEGMRSQTSSDRGYWAVLLCEAGLRNQVLRMVKGGKPSELHGGWVWCSRSWSRARVDEPVDFGDRVESASFVPEIR
jgi:hypothetical protein